jgi:hypothetical protein
MAVDFITGIKVELIELIAGYRKYRISQIKLEEYIFRKDKKS